MGSKSSHVPLLFKIMCGYKQFKAMFPDREISSKFEMSKAKCVYTINYKP